MRRTRIADVLIAWAHREGIEDIPRAGWFEDLSIEILRAIDASPGAAPDSGLREALIEAVALIRAWHGMGHGEEEPFIWALYQNSPEMKRINSALQSPTPQTHRIA